MAQAIVVDHRRIYNPQFRCVIMVDTRSRTEKDISKKFLPEKGLPQSGRDIKGLKEFRYSDVIQKYDLLNDAEYKARRNR